MVILNIKQNTPLYLKIKLYLRKILLVCLQTNLPGMKFKKEPITVVAL